MAPDDFKRLWEADGDQLCPIPAVELSNVSIPISAKSFLSHAGLPEDAAPFLSFGESSRSNASKFLQMFGKYPDLLVLGSNGSGDPIAMRLDGVIIYMNHDRGLAERYINKDIETFAETALRIRQIIADVQQTFGDDAYLDGMVPIALKEGFRSFLSDVDPLALEPGALWIDEISSWAEDR